MSKAGVWQSNAQAGRVRVATVSKLSVSALEAGIILIAGFGILAASFTAYSEISMVRVEAK